jgi:hypothetical protein
MFMVILPDDKESWQIMRSSRSLRAPLNGYLMLEGKFSENVWWPLKNTDKAVLMYL